MPTNQQVLDYQAAVLAAVKAVAPPQDAVTTTPPPPTPTTPTVLSPVAEPVGPLVDKSGAGTVDYGVFLGYTELITNGQRGPVEKQHIFRNDHDNVRVMAWNTTAGGAVPVSPPVVLRDLVLEDASAVPPRSLNGTTESNLWVGCTANVSRVIGRRGAWMGLWTGGGYPVAKTPPGGCYGTVIEDTQWLEQPNVGVYIEHVTRNTTIRRFKVGMSGPGNGVIVEWWYSGSGSSNCTLEDFEIVMPPNTGQYGTRSGWAITLDAGTFGFKINKGLITGGKGIELPKNLVDATKPNTVSDVWWRKDAASPWQTAPISYHTRAIG